jgi:acyl-CoA synthetase (AMP-forming)/AMP-acid ligase II
MTYGQLQSSAASIAGLLADLQLAQRPVLLVYEAGLDFAPALLGCLSAGALAVPAPVPLFPAQRRRFAAIVRACQPRALLATTAVLTTLERRLADDTSLSTVPRYATDALEIDARRSWPAPRDPDEPALLQCSSGSTAAPKAIVLTQANLAANVSMIAQAFGVRPGMRCLSWMPHTHDMGLIGGLITPLATGCDAFLMSPTAFLQRPARWLASIAGYHIETSGGPDFAYALVADRVTPAEAAALDLRAWQVAYVGAEAVRGRTLDRFTELVASAGFDRTALMPAYGLAEATLLVASASRGEGASRVMLDRARLLSGDAVSSTSPDAVVLTRCGRPAAATTLRIIDPETGRRCPPEQVGEICIAGPQVSFKRWPDTANSSSEQILLGTERLLRSGDLGYLDQAGLVFLDRLKDVLVFKGQNHACHDVEATAMAQAAPGLLHACAAILAEEDGTPRLVILGEGGKRAVVAGEMNALFRRMRTELSRCHGLGLATLAIVRAHSLPRTTSGKLRRQECRRLFVSGELAVVARFGDPGRHPAND